LGCWRKSEERIGGFIFYAGSEYEEMETQFPATSFRIRSKLPAKLPKKDYKEENVIKVFRFPGVEVKGHVSLVSAANTFFFPS